MPQIIEQGSNQQVQRAAGGVLQGIQLMLQQEQEKKDRAFAQERFQFQKDQAAINNDFRQQGMDMQRDQIEYRHRRDGVADARADEQFQLSKNADARAQESHDARITHVEMNAEQEEMARKWYVMQLQDHGASPEEVAVLQNADMSVLETASGRVMMRRQLEDGAQSLEALTMTVIEAMNPDPEQSMDENDPTVVGLREAYQASVGSLEGQAAFREAMISQLEKIESIRADARERVENVAGIEPAIEQFMPTISPSQRGILNARKKLYLSGEIEFSDFLDSWSKIERDKYGGSTGQTAGERYFNAFASRRGTEDAQDVDDGGADFAAARARANEIDGTAAPQQPQQSASRGGGPVRAKSSIRPSSYPKLVSDFGSGTITEAIELASQKQDPQERESFLTNRAFALAKEKYGDDPSDEQIAEILAPLLSIVDGESPLIDQ